MPEGSESLVSYMRDFLYPEFLTLEWKGCEMRKFLFFLRLMCQGEKGVLDYGQPVTHLNELCRDQSSPKGTVRACIDHMEIFTY